MAVLDGMHLGRMVGEYRPQRDQILVAISLKMSHHGLRYLIYPKLPSTFPFFFSLFSLQLSCFPSSYSFLLLTRTLCCSFRKLWSYIHRELSPAGAWSSWSYVLMFPFCIFLMLVALCLMASAGHVPQTERF